MTEQKETINILNEYWIKNNNHWMSRGRYAPKYTLFSKPGNCARDLGNGQFDMQGCIAPDSFQWDNKTDAENIARQVDIEVEVLNTCEAARRISIVQSDTIAFLRKNPQLHI